MTVVKDLWGLIWYFWGATQPRFMSLAKPFDLEFQNERWVNARWWIYAVMLFICTCRTLNCYRYIVCEAARGFKTFSLCHCGVNMQVRECHVYLWQEHLKWNKIGQILNLINFKSKFDRSVFISSYVQQLQQLPNFFICCFDWSCQMCVKWASFRTKITVHEMKNSLKLWQKIDCIHI